MEFKDKLRNLKTKAGPFPPPTHPLQACLTVPRLELSTWTLEEGKHSSVVPFGPCPVFVMERFH